MKKTLLAVILAAATLAAVLACTFTVDESEYAVVLRFGDPRRVVDEAGLCFRWPPPIDQVRRIDRRIHVLAPKPDEVLTMEKKNVLVSTFLTWSVEDPIRYLVTVSDRAGAEARLTAIMRSEVDTALGAHPLSDLVSEEEGDEGRASIAQVSAGVTDRTAREASEGFGIKVWAIRIKRLNFPRQNKEAVFRRMEAERERIAKGYRAEGEEQADRIRAQADREEAVIVSEARRKAEVKRGEADAEATRIYAEAFGRDPAFYEFLRALQTYRKIIGAGSTVVVPSDSKLLEVLADPKRFRKAGPEREDER